MMGKTENEQIKYLSTQYAKKGALECEYSVRGRVLTRANEIQAEIDNGSKKYEFDTIVYANIGNPQGLGVSYITYCRQILAASLDNSLLKPESPYPEDVKKKAAAVISSMCNGSTGAYTETAGLLFVRKKIADMITARDGYESNPDNIIITTGATQGITSILELLISGNNVGILTPAPVYPLYSAIITYLEGSIVWYNLDSENKWEPMFDDLEEKIATSTKEIRAICVLNPGNPTVSLYSEDCIRKVIKIAKKNNFVIIADEVYQKNIYGDRKFVSFRKVLYDLGPEYNNVQLISVNSISKGLYCECGLRAGYIELINVDEDEMKLINKIFSIKLCPPTPGQISLYTLVDPPVPGDPSYPLFIKEINKTHSGFSNAISYFNKYFEKYHYIKTEPPTASIYLFFEVILPNKFIEAAKADKTNPDEYFCMKLVEKKGICTTPGSGFNSKKPESYFIRIAVTPVGIERICDSLKYVIDWVHETYK